MGGFPKLSTSCLPTFTTTSANWNMMVRVRRSTRAAILTSLIWRLVSHQSAVATGGSMLCGNVAGSQAAACNCGRNSIRISEPTRHRHCAGVKTTAPQSIQRALRMRNRRLRDECREMHQLPPKSVCGDNIRNLAKFPFVVRSLLLSVETYF